MQDFVWSGHWADCSPLSAAAASSETRFIMTRTGSPDIFTNKKFSPTNNTVLNCSQNLSKVSECNSAWILSLAGLSHLLDSDKILPQIILRGCSQHTWVLLRSGAGPTSSPLPQYLTPSSVLTITVRGPWSAEMVIVIIIITCQPWLDITNWWLKDM